MKFPIPDTALAQHIAVLGMTGSGKTSTEKLLIEHVVAGGARVCVLDTLKSDWWGITSSASGKSPGLPFKILGGPRGHLPLHSSAGKAIGQLVGSGKLPLSIIDMADFEAGGVQRFFVDFAQSLWKHIRGVVYLPIEEAHELAPKERAGFNQENMSIHWAKKLATGSRTKGIRLMVATQRIQALHNAVLGSCGTLIAHRCTFDADQEPIIKWLKAANKEKAGEIAETLSKLPDGTGWLCSGREQIFERIAFPKFKTYDNTATPTGDEDDVDVKTATVDQDELRAIIGDAVKDAIANDPTELKKQINELKRQVAAKPQAGHTDAEWRAAMKQAEDLASAAAFARGSAAGYTKGIEDVANAAEGMMTNVAADARALIESVQRNRKTFEDIVAAAKREGAKVAPTISHSATTIPRQIPRGQPPEPSRLSPRASQALPRRSPTISSSNGAGEALPKGEAATLTACIQFPDGLRREQLTVLTGYKRSSRDAYIQRLRERGYVDTSGDRVIATDAGIAAMPDAEPLPTGKDLREYWLARLPEGERKVLEILIERGGDAMPRADLDELTGYQRSSRDAYLQRLRAKQLISEPSRGEVRASENLF